MRYFALPLALFLAGCYNASQYIGQDISNVMMAEGPPENVFLMPDGRMAYQWRIGGGSTVYLPGDTYATTTYDGSSAQTFASSTPGVAYKTRGCIVTFIAAETERGWIVDDWQSPCGIRD